MILTTFTIKKISNRFLQPGILLVFLHQFGNASFLLSDVKKYLGDIFSTVYNFSDSVSSLSFIGVYLKEYAVFKFTDTTLKPIQNITFSYWWKENWKHTPSKTLVRLFQI